MTSVEPQYDVVEEEGEDWIKAEEITIDLQGRGLTDAKDMEEEKEEESEPQLLELHRVSHPDCAKPLTGDSPMRAA